MGTVQVTTATVAGSYSGPVTVIGGIGVTRVEEALGSSVESARLVRIATGSIAASGTRSFQELPEQSVETGSGSGSSAAEPPWQTYLRRRLSDLWARSGRPNYPAFETLNGAWHVAHGVLGSSTPSPSVLPGDDRAVDLVWNGRWHVELEIGRRGSYVWAKNRETGEVVSGDLDELRDVLPDLVLDRFE